MREMCKIQTGNQEKRERGRGKVAKDEGESVLWLI